MRDETPECLRCKRKMSLGYTLSSDQHKATRMIPFWVEGTPVKSFWQGYMIKNRRVMSTVTYRCEKCGLLESYAKAQS